MTFVIAVEPQETLMTHLFWLGFPNHCILLRHNWVFAVPLVVFVALYFDFDLTKTNLTLNCDFSPCSNSERLSCLSPANIHHTRASSTNLTLFSQWLGKNGGALEISCADPYFRILLSILFHQLSFKIFFLVTDHIFCFFDCCVLSIISIITCKCNSVITNCCVANTRW